MTDFLARLRVISTATVTWLVFAATALTVVAEELATVDGAGTMAAWCLRIVAWLGAAVAIIRRVAPVPLEERGVLPIPAGSTDV